MGVPGQPRGQFFFLSMVMWHIKLTGMMNRTECHPKVKLVTLGRGQKVKYEISFTKSISKIFVPNFVCILTVKRHKIYQPEFSFCDLGHATGVGLGVLGG